MKVLKVLKHGTRRFFAILRSWISAPAQDWRKTKIFEFQFPYGQWLFWQARIAPKGPTSIIQVTTAKVTIELSDRQEIEDTDPK